MQLPIIPPWSPDGTKIAFTKYVNSRHQIFGMDADGKSNVPDTIPQKCVCQIRIDLVA